MISPIFAGSIMFAMMKFLNTKHVPPDENSAPVAMFLHIHKPKIPYIVFSSVILFAYFNPIFNQGVILSLIINNGFMFTQNLIFFSDKFRKLVNLPTVQEVIDFNLKYRKKDFNFWRREIIRAKEINLSKEDKLSLDARKRAIKRRRKRHFKRDQTGSTSPDIPKD